MYVELPKQLASQSLSTGSASCPEASRTTVCIATSWSDSPISLHFRALASALADRGHRVLLLIDGRRADVVSPDSNPAVLTWPSSRPTRWPDARFLRAIIRHRRPGALIANFGAVNVMMTVGWLQRVPLRIAWYHTLSSATELDRGPVSWQHRLQSCRKRFVYRAATHIVANSQATRDDVQRTYGVPSAKCRVFYNSLPESPDGAESPEASTQSAAAAERLVLCVGRLHPCKGQDVLIRAAARLRDRGVVFRIELVGEGPQRSDLEALVDELHLRDRCQFIGALPRDQALTRMAHAWVTVVPSRSEAFGLVNIESMSVGTPVVASAVGGIVELLENGREGFLFPPGDYDTLAERLQTLINDEALRARMGRNARQRSRSFAQSRLVAEQVQWLESLIGTREC